MPVFRVLASRTEYYAIEAFFRAKNRDEAELAFHSALEAGPGALDWTHDYGGSDTEIDSVEDITESHEATPSGMDRRECRLCGRMVKWTGIPPEASPTGALIPGPWIHVENTPIDQGVGL